LANQYLDYQGLQTLVTALKALFLKKTDTTSLFDIDGTIIDLNVNTALKFEGNGIDFEFNAERNALIMTSASGAEYSIKENTLPIGSQYAAQYQLYKNNVAIEGSIINVPKDKYLTNVAITEINNENRNQYIDLPNEYPNGKYLIFTVGEDIHYYILINDLIWDFTAGNGIDITEKVISVKIIEENGLHLNENGIYLSTVTTTDNGAMLASDKIKLNSLENNEPIPDEDIELLFP